MSKMFCGTVAGQLDEDFDVLPGGVEDLDDLVVGEELEEGLEAEAIGEGIDEDRLVGRGRLQEAELRPVGRFAQELGIDGDEIELGGTRAEARPARRSR